METRERWRFREKWILELAYRRTIHFVELLPNLYRSVEPPYVLQVQALIRHPFVLGLHDAIARRSEV